MLFFKRFFGFAIFLLWLKPVVSTEEWPQYRFNAGRTASSPNELPESMTLQWSRQLPATAPAWPAEPRKDFDWYYHPIAANGMVFISFSHNDSIAAFDINSGKEAWRFYTGGPVRFAPVYFEGRVLAGSDDGFLYCLDSKKGTLIWKKSGKPTSRKILGNNRLISPWPLRGGPVLKDGMVYFTAGIWPFTGIYIHALDAKTGKIIWTNDKTGATMKSGKKSSGGGTAPQGYLTANARMLIVPNGRASPAGLNRQTGAFQLTIRMSPEGGAIVANDSLLIHQGKMTSQPANRRKTVGIKYLKNPLLREGMIFFNLYGYKKVRDVRIPYMKTIVACNTQELILGLAKKRKRGSKVFPGQKWEKPGDFQVFITAGSHLYIGTKDKVASIKIPVQKVSDLQEKVPVDVLQKKEKELVSSTEIKITWNAPLVGWPSGMIAAQKKLFVITRDHKLFCFGQNRKDPVHLGISDKKAEAGKNEGPTKIERILKLKNESTGYAVLFGKKAANMSEGLLKRTKMRLVCVVNDEQTVNVMRRKLDLGGYYGKRVSVHQGELGTFKAGPWLANLIVSEDDDIEFNQKTIKALTRLLRPYGGIACLKLSMRNKGQLKEMEAKLKTANISVLQDGDFSLITRSGRLNGSSDWTHQWGDAGNTLVSNDELVKTPLGMLWFGGESGDRAPNRHSKPPLPQIIEGRLYFESQGRMTAVDVYTGRLLWDRKVPGFGKGYTRKPGFSPWQQGSTYLGGDFLSSKEGIYLFYDDKCERLNPATGETEHTFNIGKVEGLEGKIQWGSTRIYKNFLVAAVDPFLFDPKILPGSAADVWNGVASRAIQVLDRFNGKVFWSRRADQMILHNAFACGSKKVFFVDQKIQLVGSKYVSKDNPGAVCPEKGNLVAIDLATGKVAWSQDSPLPCTWLAYSEKHDIVVQVFAKMTSNRKRHPAIQEIRAYKGAGGALLWKQKVSGYGPIMVNDDTILIRRGKFIGLLDGKIGDDTYKSGYGCNIHVASKYLVTFRSGSSGYWDLKNKTGPHGLNGFRSGCLANLIVANGVLNAPNFARRCGCLHANQTALALIHLQEEVPAPGAGEKKNSKW